MIARVVGGLALGGVFGGIFYGLGWNSNSIGN
jgi:hypothetical protein